MNSILNNILPAGALGIEVTSWSNGRVELTAPLAKNLNDKGTAFAGSIDSLLDLAGWSAITFALRDAGLEADVMIVKSDTRYSTAVRADITATAEISSADVERMVQELKVHGRSCATLTSQVDSENKTCAASTAHYVVISRA